MPGTTNRDKVEDPCEACKARHLKCDDIRPKCRQCTRSGKECHRPSGKIKFRPGSTAKYDTTFGKHQTWSQIRNAKLQFVDAGPELEHQYALEHQDSPEDNGNTEKTPAIHAPSQNGSDLNRTSSSSTLRTSSAVTPVETNPSLDRVRSVSDRATLSPPGPADLRTPLSPLKRSLPEDALPRPSQVHPSWHHSTVSSEPQDMRNTFVWYKPMKAYRSGGHNGEEMQKIGQVVQAEMRRLEDDNAAAIPTDHFLSPAEWRLHFRWPNEWTTNQCTSLMRYFIEELGPWFDAGDPNKRFTTVVPRNACYHPPLLNAIFTAAAIHLVASKQHRASDGSVRYKGVSLPRLTEETPWRYFQAVIAYLQKATDPQSVRDDDFLAAAVILRFAEEFQQSITGERNMAFTPTFDQFMRARAEAEEVPETPSYTPSSHRHTLPPIRSPPGPQQPYTLHERQLQDQAYKQLKSFEHACYRVALRQEVYAAFLTQTVHELYLPKTWTALDAFPEPEDEDFIWTDHHLRHLANVLRFCLGSEQHLGHERYKALKDYEIRWEKNKPYTFAPYHNPLELHNGSEARRASGQTAFVLPQCWFMDEVNVLGSQYIELSRILLAVYDPSRPKLGRPRNKMDNDVRESVTKICGMAINTSTSVFAKELAFVAIYNTTANFRNREELNVLLKVLDSLEDDFGWPTGHKRREVLKNWEMG